MSLSPLPRLPVHSFRLAFDDVGVLQNVLQQFGTLDLFVAEEGLELPEHHRGDSLQLLQLGIIEALLRFQQDEFAIDCLMTSIVNRIVGAPTGPNSNVTWPRASGVRRKNGSCRGGGV